ncbi:MAG TPA: hypothetical protein VF599_08410 [Pyrinomonadaceae bacterium]|jgi:hypothetical protein
MKKLFSSIALIAALALVALADVRLPDTPKPKQSKAIDTRLQIRLDKDAKEARLRIPKSQLKQLRAELDQLDDSAGTTASLSFSRTQTIVSGLFLSLAFVFGGVWLARSRGKTDSKTNKALVVVAGLFLTGAMTTIAFANIAPPVETRRIDGKIFSESVHRYKRALGKIKLEISDDSEEEIELIVPDVKTPNVTGGEEE